MSQETWQAGIGEQLDALEADIERFGVAMNAGGTWTTALGETLKTLPELIKYLQDRLTGILNRGDWQGDTHYALNDMVLADGNYYVCGVPHTSTAFVDDLAAGKWALWPTGSSNIDLSDALDGTRQAADGVAASEWALAQVNDKAEGAQETADEAMAAIQAIDALPLFSEIPCPTGILRPGFLFPHLDNGLLTKAAFPDAYAQLVSDLDAGSEAIIEGDDAWQAQKLANGGVCPKFMLDVAAETFRIPLTPGLYAREPDPGKGLKAGDYLEDQFQGHQHYYGTQVNRQYYVVGHALMALTAPGADSAQSIPSALAALYTSDTVHGTPRFGAETRPVSGVLPKMMKMYGAVVEASEANIAALIAATVRKLDTERFEVSQQVMHVQDQKPAGTPGGTFTGGAWRERDLNTVVTNTIPGASLANNQITLPAGKYEIFASAPAHFVNLHIAKFQNVQNASDYIVGTTAFTANTAASNMTASEIRNHITLAAPTTFTLQHSCVTTRANDGFGYLANNPGFGVPQIYSEVIIRRLS